MRLGRRQRSGALLHPAADWCRVPEAWACRLGRWWRWALRRGVRWRAAWCGLVAADRAAADREAPWAAEQARVEKVEVVSGGERSEGDLDLSVSSTTRSVPGQRARNSGSWRGRPRGSPLAMPASSPITCECQSSSTIHDHQSIKRGDLTRCPHRAVSPSCTQRPNMSSLVSQLARPLLLGRCVWGVCKWANAPREHESSPLRASTPVPASPA